MIVVSMISLAPINSCACAVVVVVISFVGCHPKFDCWGIGTHPLLSGVIIGGPYFPCPCGGRVLRAV